jgi:hypothetical protein
MHGPSPSPRQTAPSNLRLDAPEEALLFIYEAAPARSRGAISSPAAAASASAAAAAAAIVEAAAA